MTQTAVEATPHQTPSDPHAGTELWIAGELVYRKGDPEFEKLSREELGARLKAAFDNAFSKARKDLGLE